MTADTLTPTALFKALADDTRVRVCLLLTRFPELCVCELTEALQLSQPKISRHLALLRNQGLLADRRQGQWIYYRLHPALPDWARNVVQQAIMGQPDDLADECRRLREMQRAGAEPACP